MSKKIIVDENVLRHMLMEITKEKTAINEAITVDNAYTRFYASRINKEIYDLAVDGTVNMTPYHKALLDVVILAGEMGDDSYQTEIATSGGQVWASSNANIRQLLLKAVKGNELPTDNPSQFVKKAISISRTTAATKAQVAAEGLVKVFENDRLLITCTTTYSASRKYFADSHWCTASDIFGDYNGYEMFMRYSIYSGGFLLQFIDKNNRMDGTYQVQVKSGGVVGQVCDFRDNQETFQSVTDYFEGCVDYGGKAENLRSFFIEMIVKNYDNLSKKTREDMEKDSKIWVPKTQNKLNEYREIANEKIWSNFDFRSAAAEIVETCVNDESKNGVKELSDGKYVRIYKASLPDAPYIIILASFDIARTLGKEAQRWIDSCNEKYTAGLWFKAYLAKYTATKKRGDLYATFNVDIIKELNAERYAGHSDNYALVYESSNNIGVSHLYSVINARTGEQVLTDAYFQKTNNGYFILKIDDHYELYSTKHMRVVVPNIVDIEDNWFGSKIKVEGSDEFVHPADAAREAGMPL